MLKRILILFFPLFLLQACSSVPGVIEQPKVSVQNVSLKELSLTAGTALIALNVTNPNAFPLPLEGVEYALRLNGTPVAGGDQVQKIYIGARQTLPVEIPLKLNFSELMRLVPQALRERRVQYDLSGAVRLPLIKIPFQRQGGLGVQP